MSNSQSIIWSTIMGISSGEPTNSSAIDPYSAGYIVARSTRSSYFANPRVSFLSDSSFRTFAFFVRGTCLYLSAISRLESSSVHRSVCARTVGRCSTPSAAAWLIKSTSELREAI